MANKKTSIRRLPVFWQLMKNSFRRLKNNDPLRMAGATAFFTSFALPPILILLFQLFSIFFARKTVGRELREVLSATLGRQGAEQLRITALGLRNLAQNWYMAVIGLVFLAFVATTLFKVIRNSLNDIWNIRLKRSEFVYDLKARATSLIIMLIAGILFLVTGVIDVVIVVAGNYIGKYSVKGGLFFTSALDEIASVLVITIWLIVLFKYLANGRPSWRVTIAGGIITGILFYIGKAALATLMSHSNIGAVYGAGAAIVLILLFVFYSSFILYFGASFIKEYSLLIKDPIIPSSHAYLFEVQKVPDSNQTTQPNR
jgi:membrane protein